MIFFRNQKTKKVFAYDSESDFKKFGDPDLIRMTSDDIAVHLNPKKTPQGIIEDKLNQISFVLEKKIAVISIGYPSSEMLSWPKQEAEARAYTADGAALTPLLDALAAARGITKTELASRVIAKADLFAQVSGQLIGKCQALEDQITAIRDGLTDEELAAPITPAVQALLDAVQWDPAP